MMLAPAEQPTMYFLGVSTGQSLIQRVFPAWAERRGLDGAVLRGIDLPLRAPADEYRRVTGFLKGDPLSLGALVTTHKIDLYNACRDQFDAIDRYAALLREASCLSKSDGKLLCHAKDPISAGLALEALLPAHHWRDSGAEVFLIGAGGSATAIIWHMTSSSHLEDRPSRIVVSDRSPARLTALQSVCVQLGASAPIEYVLVEHPRHNASALSGMAPGSLVINATGLGKDTPGSPLPDEAMFPERGIVWDLNYRGDLVFLEQARRQAASRRLRVADGWVYFIHGWIQAIAEVFGRDLPTSGSEFDELAAIAAQEREAA